MGRLLELLNRAPISPKLKAAVILAVVGMIVFGLFAVLGDSGPLAILLAAWAGLFAVFVLYRIGYFAEPVTLVLPGTSAPAPQRLRKTTGRQRLSPGADPAYISVADANNSEDEVNAEDRVLGIRVGNHAIAYPLAAMSVREIAHEVLDGVHVFVTWWPVTYAARAFALRGSAGLDPDLTSVRKTLLNSMIMEDAGGSEYVQFLGQAVTGPSAGATLEQIPVLATSWRAWSQALPSTEVMSLEGTPTTDMFERYYITDRAGLYQQSSRDRRWHDKDTVIGIENNGDVRCYPYPALIERPMLNEEVGGEPLLVAHERLSATAAIFSRIVEGQALTFSGESRNPMRPAPDPLDSETPKRINYEPWFLADSQTGSKWRAISGECVSGELKGKRLRMMPGQTGFWFAWSRFYPTATVLEPRRGADGESG